MENEQINSNIQINNTVNENNQQQNNENPQNNINMEQIPQNMQFQNGMQNPNYAYVQNNYVPKKTPAGIQKMRDNYFFFGILSILYGLLFGISTYYNLHNVMTIVLTLATEGFILAAFKFFEIKTSFKTWAILLAWLALSVSSFMTSSDEIIFFNTMGMALLFATFLLVHFCDTKKWGLGKFCLEIFILPFISLIHFFDPFINFAKRKKNPNKKKSATAGYIWLGTGIAFILLLVIIPLLVSADAVFKNMFTSGYNFMHLPKYWFKIIIFGIFGWLASYGVFSYMVSDFIHQDVKEAKRFNALIAISITSPITVVYLLFSVIQISYLFIGGFTLPEGYTYAKYAREGFFQLLVVCIINIIILMVCLKIFDDNKILKAILTLFSLCTGIMIASSAMRMILYIETYELTMLRVMVLWSLTVISLLLIGCIISIYAKSFPLFNYSTIIVTILYLAFSLSNPAVGITRFNLNYNGVEDMNYIKTYLGADAIIVLDEKGMLEDIINEAQLSYEDEVKSANDLGIEDTDYYRYLNIWDSADMPYYWSKAHEEYTEMNIFSFNYSTYRAGKTLEKYVNE